MSNIDRRETVQRETAPGEPARGKPPKRAYTQTARLSPNDILRFVLELFALFTLGYWGYLAWPFPWPGALFMMGTPLFAIIVWGLFRSPKAWVPVDIVGRGIVEIAVMGSATIAWAMLGNPIISAVFGVLALVSGIINLRTESARESAP